MKGRRRGKEGRISLFSGKKVRYSSSILNALEHKGLIPILYFFCCAQILPQYEVVYWFRIGFIPQYKGVSLICYALIKIINKWGGERGNGRV